MIHKAEIISQPDSGEYKEKIYDISSVWNSQEWTWIKFNSDDSEEWCGNFRGSPKDIAVSPKYNLILVLTSDYLFELDCITGELRAFDDQVEYQCLTVSPSGDFIIADFNDLYLLKTSILDRNSIHSPIDTYGIEFMGWNRGKLLIACEDLATDGKVKLELNGETLEVVLIMRY
jgi:hypothetical protein